MFEATPDDAVYSGILGDIVETLKPSTEADPVGILGSLLAGTSAMIGGKAQVFVTNRIKHPITVWTMLVGLTSIGLKGTATGDALAVLRDVNEEFIEKNIIRGLTTGEGLIAKVADLTPKQKREMEEAGVDIPEQGHLQRLIYESEYGTVMARSMGPTATLGPVLRLAWDGDTLGVGSRTDPITATKPHLAAIGHVTPMEFEKRMSPTELNGGGYNRWMYLHVEQKQVLPSGGEYDEKKLGALIDRLRKNIAASQTEMLVKRSPEAELLWNDIVHGIRDRPKFSAQIDAFVGRQRPHILRTAATYAIADGRNIISVEDLAAAYHLFEYSIQTIRYVMGEDEETPDGGYSPNVATNSKATDLANVIKSRTRDGKGTDRTMVRTLLGGPKIPAPKMDEILALLPLRQERDNKTGGAPRQVYFWDGPLADAAFEES